MFNQLDSLFATEETVSQLHASIMDRHGFCPFDAEFARALSLCTPSKVCALAMSTCHVSEFLVGNSKIGRPPHESPDPPSPHTPTRAWRRAIGSDFDGNFCTVTVAILFRPLRKKTGKKGAGVAPYCSKIGRPPHLAPFHRTRLCGPGGAPSALISTGISAR